MHNGIGYIATALQAFLKPSHAPVLPRHLQIEVTTYCNLDCLSCGRRHIIKKPKHINFEQFSKIYNQIRPHNINLSGLGEPLLNPDIFRMIRFSVDHGSIVNFPTNLTVAPSLMDKLVDSGIQQIKVSLDAASRDVYASVRKDDKFQRVLENIRLLNNLKNSRQSRYPEIRFNFCLQKNNIGDVLPFIEMAHDLNVMTIYIQDLNYFSVEDEKSALCGIDIDTLRTTLQQAYQKASSYGISTNIQNWMRHLELLHNKMLSKDLFSPNRIICHFPWISTFIDVDGNVLPCPVCVWDRTTPALGNCFAETFRDIWNNNDYKTLRKKFKRAERTHPICERCVPPDLLDIKLIFEKMLLNKKSI